MIDWMAKHPHYTALLALLLLLIVGTAWNVIRDWVKQIRRTNDD